MREVSFNKEDIIERVYFITKLIQNQKSSTMQGAIYKYNIWFIVFLKIIFATLDRTGNDGSEYFMQKQCAFYLNGIEDQLISELKKIIEKN